MTTVTAATMAELFWERVSERPFATALRFHDADDWRPVTWKQYGDAVEDVAAGLIDLGIVPGDRVGILSNNQVRWHMSDMGVLSAGAASVPAYPTSASGQVAYVLQHSEARACFVGDRDQLAKVLLARHRLPSLEHVILLDDRPDGLDDDFLLTFDDLRALGHDRLAREPDCVRACVRTMTPTSVATIVYTSGTTGPPKGAVLTNRNLIATLNSIMGVVPIGPDDRFLSFLPLSHIAERTVSHFGQLASGGETWFARSLSTVADDLRSCRPTIFFAVPRVWEKFQGAILEEVAGSPAPLRRLAETYLRLAAQRTDAARSGAPWPLSQRVAYAVFDSVVGRKMRAGAGLDEARILVSGAAPIHPDLLWWFDGIGLPIAEVYGQTEDCGPTTLNPPDAIRVGSVGPPLPGVHVHLAEDGEILARGDNICAGYFHDPEKTAQLIDEDGWMHSGDLGRLDPDGYLHVVGRKKDLIITSSGKNIAPQELETRLRAEPLVAQAVVVGDGRSYLTALLALDSEYLGHWAAEQDKVADFEALVDDPDLRTELAASIARVNEGRAPIEQIKMWRVIPRELTVTSGELTPTLKVKRDIVAARYGELIDEMYAAA